MRTRLAPVLLGTFAVAVSVACGASKPTIVDTPIPAPPPPPAVEPAPASTPSGADATPTGVDEAALDRSVDPCEDFYTYACGGWLKSTPIPEDRSAWTRSFSEIDERNEKRLKDYLERYVGGEMKAEPYAQKLADFYATCMDEAGVEKAGLDPLKDAFGAIDAIGSGKDVGVAVQKLYAMGFHPLFAFYSGQDFGDATQVIGQLEQGGLGLPDRDYYLDKGKKPDAIRAAYQEHVAKMLELAGLDPKQAKSIVAFETELAKASMTRVDRRDPKKVYNKTDLAGVQKLAPLFGFEGFVTGLGVPKDAPLNVQQPTFVKKVSAMTQSKKPEEWRAYLKWQILNERAPSLTKAIVDQDFAFKSEHLTGAKAQLPRWKRCVAATDAALGEALAIPFVRDTFGAEGKAKTSTMIHEIEDAMQRDLGVLPWMDDPTRKKALEKLQKIKNKVGYPDAWRSYETLEIARGAHARNVLAAEAFETKRMLAKIGKPLDRGEWYMTPPTVNAYYDPNMNEMVFPAGILQPPFFDRKASDGMNYGAIGMVMGHELTHGFDDEGRKFDGDGNLKEWWSKKVDQEFEERASCVVKQYDAFVALPDPEGKGNDLKVNGKLTLGENIADLGGLKLSFEAFKDARKGKPEQTLAGFSEDQQFFLGYAQAWCQNARPQLTAVRVKVDPHSPPKFRVNGPVSNLPQFAQAFQCKEGAKMARPAADRCEIW